MGNSFHDFRNPQVEYGNSAVHCGLVQLLYCDFWKNPREFDFGNDAKALVVMQLVRDQIGRSRVWVGNMAAHRVGRMPLDYKLRESSHIHAAVLELLKELNGKCVRIEYP